MLSVVVQKAENGCIGVADQIPWFIPTAFKQWRNLTKKKTLIIGKDAFYMLPSRFKRHRNFWILTRDKKFKTRKGVVFTSVEQLLEFHETIKSVKEVMVVGGAEILRLLVPHCVKFYFIDIKGNYNGDSYFPLHDFNQINTFVASEKEFSTHFVRIYHKVMPNPYYLMNNDKIPPYMTKKRWRRYYKHYNRTTRRKRVRQKRREEREIFEFEMRPKNRKEKRLMLQHVSDKREFDPTAKLIRKRRIRGRPRKRRLITEEKRLELLKRLNISSKELRSKLNENV